MVRDRWNLTGSLSRSVRRASRFEDRLPADWREQLAAMHQEPSELPDLKAMAVQAARACGGGVWSVDFCQDDAGKFWLLDMAVAQDSYHWPGCPNGGQDA